MCSFKDLANRTATSEFNDKRVCYNIIVLVVVIVKEVRLNRRQA